MDCLFLTLVEMRRVRATLPVRALSRREALVYDLLSRLTAIDRGGMAGAGRASTGVAVPAVLAGGACVSDVSFVRCSPPVGGGKRGDGGSDIASDSGMS